MNNSVTVYVITEGQTEQTFIQQVLAPYLAYKGVYLLPSLIGRPRHKGGVVKFERACDDIRRFLSQQSDVFVSTMFDFFRIDPAWPGLNDVRDNFSSLQKAEALEAATLSRMTDICGSLAVGRRFIPYVSMYEFEALLFSNPEVLSQKAHIQESHIQTVLTECGAPEDINSRPEHAPSKRLEKMASRYKKTVTGITAAKTMGIGVMREKCPHFNDWVSALEALVGE